MMERAEYVLQRESVDGRDFIVDVFATEAGFAKAGIYLIGGRVGVSNARYSPRSVSDGLDAIEEFCNNDTSLAAAGARYQTHMAWFAHSRTLLIC
jgi:hypothetical protein